MHQPQDPITLRALNAQEQSDAAQTWSERWRDFLAAKRILEVADTCSLLYRQLSALGRGERGFAPSVPLCPHAPDSYLTDHALLMSAIAFCTAYDDAEFSDNDRLLLRLAALSHELPHDDEGDVETSNLRQQLADGLTMPEARDFLVAAWRLLDEQGTLLATLASTENSLTHFANRQPLTGDRRLDLLWYAHAAASQPLFDHRLTLLDNQPDLPVIKERAGFAGHPLANVPSVWSRIGLVHGGASKIKDYVFESSKLPEIRGASALLDRLNLQDTRALFGEKFEYRQVVHSLIDAPECVIYANGGDVLALAPASQAQGIADAIERQYIQETLTAQCVAVAGTYSLLELQYGLAPDVFWCDDYLNELVKADEQGRQILRGYYGDPAIGHGELDDERLFHVRKSFGELTTALALKRFWRREGNEGPWRDHAGTSARSLAHFETLPFGQRCSSCDRRIAVVVTPGTNDALCEPCLRKRCVGWQARETGKDCADILEDVSDWRPGEFNPWQEQFRETLEHLSNSSPSSPDLLAHYLRNIDWPWRSISKAQDLAEIGQTATPQGFIGLIYADGNNVGALIERIRSAGFYRQFASRLFEATQAAVFTALAIHLQPAKVTNENGDDLSIHPFEIVSIGGDDLILIVPADKALAISLDIAQALEDVFRNDNPSYQDAAGKVQRYESNTFEATGRPQISLSAGVVLAQENNPIFFLNDIVDALLKSAKDQAKRLKKQGYAGGTVDFMALKSVTMVTSSVGEFRRTALREVKGPARGKGCEVLNLTARPYTLHELRGLLRTADALTKARFPRSQLYHLRQQLPEGRFLSSLNYLYFTSRLSPKHSALVRREFDQSWHDSSDPVPWRRRRSQGDDADPEAPREWESVLADIVEISDFVRSPIEEERSSYA